MIYSYNIYVLFYILYTILITPTNHQTEVDALNFFRCGPFQSLLTLLSHGPQKIRSIVTSTEYFKFGKSFGVKMKH